MPKFKPKNPFTWFAKDTDGASHFGNKTKTSQFTSDLIKMHIDMGGLDINVYRMKGTFVQDEDEFGVKKDPHGVDTADEENLFDVDDQRENPFGPGHEGPTDVGSFLGVQDTVLNENRDREYDFDEIPVLRATYTVSQNELEYARFGMALAGDVLTIEVHTEDMEKQCERRLAPGDVIEMPHMREVGIDGRIANKWYEVSSIVWSPTGIDVMYTRHVSAIILRPMRHQQEFLDLFHRMDEYGKNLAEQMSNVDAMLSITQANQEKAREYVNTTWFDTTLLYFCPDHPDRQPYRWTGDGKPDNGEPVNQGADFPTAPVIGDWFLRVDFVPNRLYRYTENQRWKMMEKDIKREWQPYNWVVHLREFMSDRSDGDRERPWELKSIHDVLTSRHDRSDLAYEEKTENKEPFEVKENKGTLKG
jgi:hypothetical protein